MNTKSDFSSKTIMIHSYKGGTGKTAVSVNLALYYSKNKGKKVLLVEQDIGGPSFVDIFDLKPNYFWNDFYNQNKNLRELVVRYESMDVICANKEEIIIPPNTSSQTFFTRQLERFQWEEEWIKNQYDIVIFDTHPGYTVSLINSISIASIMVLIVRQDYDTINNTIEMFNKIYAHFQTKKTIIVENQVPTPVEKYQSLNPSINYESIKNLWTKFISNKDLVSIPLKNEIAYSLSKNKIVTEDNPFYVYIKQLSNEIESN